ncbi:NAD-dependent epimerase/dehydratase protein [Rhizobium phage RHph_TM16]|nr:NAD-dependent epimerase/dehydratase protein [Rhizobium phage RHph_TM16]
MRVAITGGSGFIGTNLMLYLQEREPNTEIVIVDIVPPQAKMGPNTKFIYTDIRDLNSLLTAFQGVDEVYHLAGILGTSELIPISALAASVNIVGANNVLDAAHRRGVSRVYNVAKPHFDGYYENAYTLTKHGGELLGQMYQQQFGMEVATVRWLNAVGPYQHLYPVRKFLPMMILLAMYGKPLEVYGDGTQTIDPIDTRDLARFTVHAIRHLGKADKIVDLGSGRAISCNDAARTIRDEVARFYRSSPVEIRNTPMRVGEKEGVNLVANMDYWTSVGMETEYDFGASIRETIKYMDGLPGEHLKNAMHFYGHKV